MMIKNYDESAEIYCNQKWPYISGHPYTILFIVGLRSGKTNVLLNLIKYQRLVVEKVQLYLKVSIIYQQKIKSKDDEQTKNSKTFIDYSQTIDDVYENLEKC